MQPLLAGSFGLLSRVTLTKHFAGPRPRHSLVMSEPYSPTLSIPPTILAPYSLSIPPPTLAPLSHHTFHRGDPHSTHVTLSTTGLSVSVAASSLVVWLWFPPRAVRCYTRLSRCWTVMRSQARPTTSCRAVQCAIYCIINHSILQFITFISFTSFS